MRLHHLEITGFGPFPETVAIDFDALSEAGLFLLSGPTGAGKSSILDAVCFALYGDVPGDRSAAKRLRSDHASADVVPRVVLEATLSGRRFRLDRSPSWQRPKKRGTGLTPEQARVVISERLTSSDGTAQWLPLSTRLDETGHLVTRLLGMNLSQFCQVAMLPQGRFQDFLRSTSQERHALLQQVFQTGRFDQVERWLRDRRVDLRRASQSHHSTVADLVSRISEVTASAAPHEWDCAPLDLPRWVGDLTSTTAEQHADSMVRVEQTHAVEREADAAVKAGLECTQQQEAYAEAQRCLSTLEDAGPRHRANTARLLNARRATGVRPLHEVFRNAAQAELESGQVASDHRQALSELLGGTAAGEHTLDDEKWVEGQRREAARLLSEITRVRPLQAQFADLEREQSAELLPAEACRARLAGVTARLVRVRDELSLVADHRHDAEQALSEAANLEVALAGWTARLETARHAESLSLTLEKAQESLRESAALRLVAREQLVEIREMRLDGMAAEIAGRLAVGCCCPVCGSQEHPALASTSPGAVDDTSEREARKSVDDLEVMVEAHTQQVRGLEAELAVAESTAGSSPEQLTLEVDHATSALRTARDDVLVAERGAQRLAALAQEQAQLLDESDTLAEALAHCATSLAVLATRIETLRKDIAAVLGDDGHDDPDMLALNSQRIEEAAAGHLRASADLRRSQDTSRAALKRADEAACEAGFASAGEADDAWLDAAETGAIQLEVQQHEQAVARVRDTLADPEISRAVAAPAPDLARLALEQDAAHGEAGFAARARDGLVERLGRLEGLSTQLHEALESWAPVLHDLGVVTDLAAFVEGKHPDNHLQMRLSAYVLAHRLSQVVQAANLRLCAMSDQRYSLVHTGQRGAGETRGGLSLLVRDEWSGESRDPATLSGGETFVVSLALALGLADVITQEAGGADLDTLFVDEGFGALDADTLEDVMDTLDTLRDGGRVVGVVSHVPELQTRIPTQLRVHKSRHGSRTSVRLG